MAEVDTRGHLAIGEVLGILLEEFPDVTISKIRFLESQGLIAPERTASGYRKFYEADVELLRVILTEQREHYLPLRVIKDRLDSGEIDPSGEHLRPRGEDATAPMSVPDSVVSSHPSGHGRTDLPIPFRRRPAPDENSNGSVAPAPRLLPGVLVERGEFLGMTGLTESQLASLEDFGIVAPRSTAGVPTYGEGDVEVGRIARDLLASGVEARHLRSWKTSAEREVALFEQLVAARARLRSPEARREMGERLAELEHLGGRLRSAMVTSAIRSRF